MDISNIRQFYKKIPFCGKGQFGQKLCSLMICSLSIFLKLCCMMDIKHQWNVGQLFQQITFSWTCQLKPNLGQNYATLSDDLLFEIFFLKCCSKRDHNRHAKVIVNFPRKYLLGKWAIWTQFEPKLCNVV